MVKIKNIQRRPPSEENVRGEQSPVPVVRSDQIHFSNLSKQHCNLKLPADEVGGWNVLSLSVEVQHSLCCCSVR